MPHIAVHRFQHAFADLAQCRRIRIGNEFADAIIVQNCLMHQIEMMGFHRVGRRSECEQVVDGRRDLERTLVAVPLHPVDPLGVHRAGAHHPPDLLIERADHRAFRA